MWFLLVTLFSCAVAILIYFIKRCHNHWQNLGIPCAKPTFFFGNMINTALGRNSVFADIATVYNQFPDCKYIGFYKFLERTVVIRDPNLVHQLLVKDFHHFADNEMVVDKNVDYISSQNLFALKGQHWYWARAVMSPMFSSGKLKHLFPLFEEVSQRMTKYINRKINSNQAKCINGKDLCCQFAIDNVASSVFGVNAKSFEGNTKFSMAVQAFNDNSFINAINFHLLFIFPRLNKYLKARFYKPEVEVYMTSVVDESLKYRKENNINRHDFLDQICSMKGHSNEHPFTNRDIVAHASGFFVDGVGTSSSIGAYVLAEIGLRPEVQKKVREEIQKAKAAHGGQLTYEAIKEMQYLDCVINETLRLHSPLGGLSKACTKAYTFPEVSDTNKTRLVLNPGDTIMIPVDCFSYDPNFFSEPNTFKPERFATENKNEILKRTFLPFGIGPRHCVGMRFALIQIKCIICATIGNFQMDVNKKMLPFELHPKAFLKAPLKGFWFDFSKLQEN